MAPTPAAADTGDQSLLKWGSAACVPPPPAASAAFRTRCRQCGRISRASDEAAGAGKNRARASGQPIVYELTLRLEKGDTVEKMLADIDVPEADRKQIAREAPGAPQEAEAGRRRRRSSCCCRTMPEQPDAPRVLSLVGASAARARVHHHTPRRRHV